MYAGQVNEVLLGRMLDFSPSVVIIILGGNDLSAGYGPGMVVNSLLGLRDRLLSAGVSRVYVGEIFERSRLGSWTGMSDPPLVGLFEALIAAYGRDWE